jgi:hypothetical protein
LIGIMIGFMSKLAPTVFGVHWSMITPCGT